MSIDDARSQHFALPGTKRSRLPPGEKFCSKLGSLEQSTRIAAAIRRLHLAVTIAKLRKPVLDETDHPLAILVSHAVRQQDPLAVGRAVVVGLNLDVEGCVAEQQRCRACRKLGGGTQR